MLNEDFFYEQYALVCKTIVNPVRLKIIEVIGDKKMNVSQIQEKMNISMSNLSNHLGALHLMGVLGREKKGNFIYYFLNDLDLLAVLEMMKKVVGSIVAKRDGMIKEQKRI
ncbi:ArsR/SmtB family transcription factor [Acidobacteriota bacterium]